MKPAAYVIVEFDSERAHGRQRRRIIVDTFGWSEGRTPAESAAARAVGIVERWHGVSNVTALVAEIDGKAVFLGTADA